MWSSTWSSPGASDAAKGGNMPNEADKWDRREPYRVVPEGDTVRVVLATILDQPRRREHDEELLGLVDQYRRVVFVATPVRDIITDWIKLFVSCTERGDERGTKVVVEGAPKFMRKKADVVALGGVLKWSLGDGEEEAT